MSIYETSITNPKKQLEFYKQLSEQLQQENEQLKADYGTKVQVERDLLKEENQKYKEVIDRIEKYIEKETRIYGLSMSIELGTHFDNILGILKEVE